MNKDKLLSNYKDLKLKCENLKSYNKTNFLNCNEEKMKRLRSKEDELKNKIKEIEEILIKNGIEF